MAVQNDFFTWQSLATFAGTTTATTIVTNGICRVAPGFKHPAPLGLFLALLFCVLAAAIDASTGNLVLDRPFATYLIAVVNGFFVFASSAGLSAGGTAVARGTSSRRTTSRGSYGSLPNPEVPQQSPIGFWRHWF